MIEDSLTCREILPEAGLVASGYSPHCYWQDMCRREGRCFWARWHQMERPVEDRQRDLFGASP